MKTIKIVGLVLLLVFLPVMAMAGVAELWSTTQTKECFSISCPSSDATQVLDINTNRVAWTISNPDTTYSVYITTYAATALDGATTGKAWHKIPPLSSYYEEINPYLGAIYILTPSGQSAITISGEERWR